MIRVLFVEASSGGVVGGSLTGLIHEIRALDRSRFAPAIVLYEPKAIEADLRALGVPVYHVKRRRLPKEHALLKYEGYRKVKSAGTIRSILAAGRQSLRLIAEELPAALRLVRVIREAKADVLHLGNGVRANFDGILAGLLSRTPVVCHVKGFEKYAPRERRIARHIDCLVPMTEAVAAHCRAAGVAGRQTVVVYDALEASSFSPSRPAADLRRELRVGDAPLLGVAGNIQEWKGQTVLVEAMALLHRDVPEARALIIGGVHASGAAYAEAMRERVRTLGLGQSVIETGFRSDIADVLNALDIVVHTSTRPEPFGRVILEGMLLGKPVVATAAGGVPEIISNGMTGFLVAPGDPQALAQALLPLLRDASLRHRVGNAARDWAAERFSMARHVREFSEIYSNLVRSH